MPPYSTARRVLSWALLALGVVVVIVSLVQGFTADPNQGEGWIGGPIQAVFMGGPLLAIGLSLRSQQRLIARRTAVASVSLAVLVGFVLVMQLLDSNEIASDRLLSGAGVIVYLAAFVIELPSFTTRWPSTDTTAPYPGGPDIATDDQ
jgi:hypothetical protein